MPLRGDFGRLRNLARGFAAAASAVRGGAVSAASAALTRRENSIAEESRAAVQQSVAECFLYQRDPDGVAWIPRKTVYGDYRDTNPILFDILSSLQFKIERTGSGFRIKVESSKYYAFFHQTGTRRGLPARRFLPSQNIPHTLREQVRNIGLKLARSVVNRLGGV